jgi:hypothetical protein
MEHGFSIAYRANIIMSGLDLVNPPLLGAPGVRPRLALVQQIWSCRFRALNDRPLSLACWGAMTSEFLLCVLFLLLVLDVLIHFSTVKQNAGRKIITHASSLICEIKAFYKVVSDFGYVTIRQV